MTHQSQQPIEVYKLCGDAFKQHLLDNEKNNSEACAADDDDDGGLAAVCQHRNNSLAVKRF